MSGDLRKELEFLEIQPDPLEGLSSVCSYARKVRFIARNAIQTVEKTEVRAKKLEDALKQIKEKMSYTDCGADFYHITRIIDGALKEANNA